MCNSYTVAFTTACNECGLVRLSLRVVLTLGLWVVKVARVFILGNSLFTVLLQKITNSGVT